MKIKQITPNIFEEFADNHPYHNFHQTLNYALLKVEEGYKYEFVALYDGDEIKAACLVLGKKINGKPYGYIPDSFLIDYNDKELLKTFTKELIYYYKKQGFIFIKINPRVVIGHLDKKDGHSIPNEMSFLPKYLQSIGYTKLKDNMYFESRLPRFNAIIDLDFYDLDTINKNNRNKARKASRKGVEISLSDYDHVSYLSNVVGNNAFDKYHFPDYYSIFDKNGMVDYFIAEIDYKEYLQNAQAAYEEELSRNRTINNLVISKPSKRMVNRKMNSDAALEAYHADILKANSLINENNCYIAACMVVKYKETATLLINGYDKKYKDFAPNYLMLYSVMDYYKDKFKYFDLNGIVGDFKDNKYHGLNRFKLGFNPTLVEYVGEYDLIINRLEYELLNKKGLLAEEFNK